MSNYDKSGRKLPEPMETTVHSNKDTRYKKCNNCSSTFKSTHKVSYRFFGDPMTKYQGPLCPNCSELPTDKVKTRSSKKWW